MHHGPQERGQGAGDFGKEIDAKELMTNYNLDVICSTGFGIEANCFNSTEDSLLVQMVSFYYL